MESLIDIIVFLILVILPASFAFFICAGFASVIVMEALEDSINPTIGIIIIISIGLFGAYATYSSITESSEEDPCLNGTAPYSHCKYN